MPFGLLDRPPPWLIRVPPDSMSRSVSFRLTPWSRRPARTGIRKFAPSFDDPLPTSAFARNEAREQKFSFAPPGSPPVGLRSFTRPSLALHSPFTHPSLALHSETKKMVDMDQCTFGAGPLRGESAPKRQAKKSEDTRISHSLLRR